MTSVFEVARFGIVGVSATLVHYVSAIVLVERIGIDPLWANIAGFGAGFPVSFAGHMFWTFRDQTVAHTTQDRFHSWVKFLATALVGLAVSQLVVFVAVDVMSVHHRIGFAAALILAPAVVFLLSKFWAFRAAV